MLIFRRAMALAAFCSVSLTTQPIPAHAKKAKCFPRQGHCVTVKVNGQPAVPLTKTTKKALKSFEKVTHYLSDTRYEVPDPIRGELDVVANMVAGAEAKLGTGARADIQIVPLQEVEIETDQRLVAEPSVRIEGRAAVTAGRFLQDNRLPPGKYLLRVSLRGSDNWDRQTVFFVVEE